MSYPQIHIIGAGLAGLAAAVTLATPGRQIHLHEAARQAGGRCRSYRDATLDMMIDNGNHLLLSGNQAALSFLDTIGSRDQLKGPPDAAFPFVDLASQERWTLRPNAGPLPWWIFVPSRRVPGTRALDYLQLARLMGAGRTDRIDSRVTCDGQLYHRLWQPLLLAALNTDPPESSAALAATVIRETLAKGGAACRPLVAAEGLADAFVDPALAYLQKRGVAIRFDHPLRGLTGDAARVTHLDFEDETIALGPSDAVVLAVPPPVAQSLLPELRVPTAFRAIVNAHFKRVPPPDAPPILGLINGTAEWIFAFDDRISITISGADRLLDVPRDALAMTLWSDVKAAFRLEDPLPPWQIIREKRATFAATPDEDGKRPGTKTRFANLALAGDWTATGLPATIEGSIRSGYRAAEALA
jgi:squalene-associated FAD-dependent desaturase